MYIDEFSQESNESKDVTIRGVDAELYDRFSKLASELGLSTGQLFSHILRYSYYSYNVFPEKTCVPKHVRHKKHQKQIEIIKDKQELLITRQDLEAIQDIAWIVFVRIQNLVFDKDIDSELLLKTVGSIRECKNVEFLGEVSDLVKVGLVFRKPVYSFPSDPSSTKDITIRNVSKPVYQRLLAEAKERNMKVGELFSEKLAIVLPRLELRSALHFPPNIFPLFITNLDKIILKKTDLELLGERKVVFYHVQHLEISNNVPQELFVNHILAIVSCSEVIVPSTIPKLIFLARVHNCAKITYA